MQEIATGVYVGNFNSRVREYLWKRVCDSVGSGEATMSFTSRNEIGYDFQTVNSERQVIDYEGIPLIMIPAVPTGTPDLTKGFSNAAKYRKSRRVSKGAKAQSEGVQAYIVLDLETTGLDPTVDEITEIGAVRCDVNGVSYFHRLLHIEKSIPKFVADLTGITSELLFEEGQDVKGVLEEFLNFISDDLLVGYNLNFDMQFLGECLRRNGYHDLPNKTCDLMKLVKKERMFQNNYKLETTLKEYGINSPVPHRAMEDAKLIYELSKKVKIFR